MKESSMGLDMYAYTIPTEYVGNQQVDIKLFNNGSAICPELNTEFAYWRKFNNLHQWMARLYFEKGGTDANFNCNTVRLMPDDLDRLEAEAAALEPAAGFFWGELEEMTPEDVAEVTAFVLSAKAAIAEGKAVVYDSWW